MRVRMVETNPPAVWVVSPTRLGGYGFHPIITIDKKKRNLHERPNMEEEKLDDQDKGGVQLFVENHLVHTQLEKPYIVMLAMEVINDFSLENHPYSEFVNTKGTINWFRYTKELATKEIKRRDQNARPNAKNKKLGELVYCLKTQYAHKLTENDKAFIIQKEKELREELLKRLEHQQELQEEAALMKTSSDGTQVKTNGTKSVNDIYDDNNNTNQDSRRNKRKKIAKQMTTSMSTANERSVKNNKITRTMTRQMIIANTNLVHLNQTEYLHQLNQLKEKKYQVYLSICKHKQDLGLKEDERPPTDDLIYVAMEGRYQELEASIVETENGLNACKEIANEIILVNEPESDGEPKTTSEINNIAVV